MFNHILQYLKNNKMIVILISILIYFLVSKYVNNKESMVNNKKKDKINELFSQSDKFLGERKGYIFKMGEKGLGYYLDKN
jgi:hypothetical protein